MKKLRYTKKTGFSIVEILIFTLLTSMVLIAMSYATLISVRNSQSSTNKTLSTRYIQQAQEWLRGQKEIDWNVFANSLNVATYCINSLPDSISLLPSQQGACTANNYGLVGRFKRELTITSVNLDETEITYTVKNYWRDGVNVQSAQVSSLLAQWE